MTPKSWEIYQHYKKKGTSQGIYLILSVSTHTETGEIFVNYRGQDGRDWSRPLEMFMETVEYEGEIVPRFTKLYGEDDESQKDS